MAVCDAGEWGIASLNVTRHRCDELCYDKLHLRDGDVSAGQVLVDIRGHQDSDTANLEADITRYKERAVDSLHGHIHGQILNDFVTCFFIRAVLIWHM